MIVGVSRLFVPALMLAWSATIANAEQVTIDLKIDRGRVAQNLRVIRVKQGDDVKLRWSTDRSIALHLHGYDIETKVEPRAVAEMTFTARATGRFPVHAHTGKVAGAHTHDEHPIVRIEVHPR